MCIDRMSRVHYNTSIISVAPIQSKASCLCIILDNTLHLRERMCIDTIAYALLHRVKERERDGGMAACNWLCGKRGVTTMFQWHSVGISWSECQEQLCYKSCIKSQSILQLIHLVECLSMSDHLRVLNYYESLDSSNTNLVAPHGSYRAELCDRVYYVALA